MSLPYTTGNHMKISTKLIFGIVCFGTVLSFDSIAFAECPDNGNPCTQYTDCGENWVCTIQNRGGNYTGFCAAKSTCYDQVVAQAPDCDSDGCVCYINNSDNAGVLYAKQCNPSQYLVDYITRTNGNNTIFVPEGCSAHGPTYTIIETSNIDGGYGGLCEGRVNQFQYRSCDTCQSGYTRVEFQAAVEMLKQGTATLNGSPRLPCYSRYASSVINFSNASTTNPIYVCVKQQEQQPTCTDTYGNWVDVRTGYQQRIHTNTSCNTTYEYRCATGYFGTPTNGTTGCTKCQPIEGIESTTTQPGATSCTSCCISANKTSNDGTGNFEILSQCCHTSPTCK